MHVTAFGKLQSYCYIWLQRTVLALLLAIPLMAQQCLWTTILPLIWQTQEKLIIMAIVHNNTQNIWDTSVQEIR